MSMYLCTHCGTVFSRFPDYKTNEHNFCSLAECNTGDVIEIDDSMVYIIKELYDKGYKTEYCCSGHPYSDVSDATYIIFPLLGGMTIELTRQLVLLMREDYRFTHILVDDESDFGRIELRCEIVNHEHIKPLGRQRILNEINIDLINWAIRLPLACICKGEKENG